MTRGLTCLALVLACAPARAADLPETVRITVRPAKEPVPAMKVRLLPDAIGGSVGNAAPLYYRAVVLAGKDMPADVKKQLDAWHALPLDRLPREEVRQLLGKYKPALRELGYAARREVCEWGLPVEQQDYISMLLPELVPLRDLARVLAAQVRLDLAEGHLDKALEGLRTGFGLARHLGLGQGPFLLYGLVGNGVGLIMSEPLRELVQQPGAPSLYWALTAMPPQFMNLHRTAHAENVFLYHQYPVLREVNRRPLSAAEAKEMEKFFEEVISWINEEGAPEETNKRRQALREAVKKPSPEARQFLLAQGRTPQEVDALPAAQVIAVYSLHQFHRLSDNLLKWAGIPFWQAHAGLAKAEEEMGDFAKRLDGAPFVTSVASFGKVQRRMARTERAFAALRCVEALRLYAAANGGKLPALLADATEVPVPLDPITGKPFEYQLSGDRATLSGPPPAGQTADATNTIRYELTVAR